MSFQARQRAQRCRSPKDRAALEARIGSLPELPKQNPALWAAEDAAKGTSEISISVRHREIEDSHRLEQQRAARHNRRALIKLVGGEITDDDWQEVLAKYGHRCLSCGATEDLAMDHVIPIAMGGPNTKENIQPLCRCCNSSKGANYIDYRPDKKKT